MLLCHFRKGHLYEEVIVSANQSWLMLWCHSEAGMVLPGSDITLCGERCSLEVSWVFKIFTLVTGIQILLFGCSHHWITLLLICVLLHSLNSATFLKLTSFFFLIEILGKISGFLYFLKLWWYYNSWCLQIIQVMKLTKGNSWVVFWQIITIKLWLTGSYY